MGKDHVLNISLCVGGLDVCGRGMGLNFAGGSRGDKKFQPAQVSQLNAPNSILHIKIFAFLILPLLLLSNMNARDL